MTCISGCILFRPHSIKRMGWLWADTGKNARGRNETLWCVPLSMELIVAAGMFHLPCGCMAMDWQAWGMTGMSGCIPFRPHSTHWMGWFWADLAKTHMTEMKHFVVRLLSWS